MTRPTPPFDSPLRGSPRANGNRDAMGSRPLRVNGIWGAIDSRSLRVNGDPGRPERAAQRRVEGQIPALACLAGVALLAACPGKGSSTPRRDAGDAGAGGGTAAAGDAAGGAVGGGTPAGTVAPYRLALTDADGGVAGGATLTVRVLWPSAPAAVRASPGYTSCHTPRRPAVRIGTLHGVAGAVVVLDGVAAGKAPPAPTDVHVTVRDCAIEPPVLAAPRLGVALEVQSQDLSHSIVVERVGRPWLEDDGIEAPVLLARTSLPAMGHTVAVALDQPGAVRVIANGAVDDAAWVLAPPHPYAGITDDVGQLVLDAVPPGSYTVVAWLPPGAGQPAQRAFASMTVAAGTDAEVTVTFAVPGAAGTPRTP